MAIQLGSAYGKVSLNTSGLTNGVKTGVAGLQQLQKAGVVLGNGMKAAGRTLTLGLTLPIVALGGAAISAASSFEETKNKAEVVFGEMADSVVSNANKASATLKLSKTEYLDYASSLGAIFTSGGMGIKEATELAEQSVKHIVDLGSFHEAAAADVSAAWQSAIRGQYEPIQRYFPFITNEFIKTYGTANGLLDSNTKNLTANQRAIILNAIALDEKLNPALNDMAETGGSLANQVKGTQAEFKNLLITLGENLLPIALEVVTTLNKMLAAFNNFSPVQQKMVLGFLAMAAAVGPLLSFLGTLVSTATGLIGLFGPGGVLAGAGTAITAMGTSISTIAVPALGALAAALLPILAVLAAVIATLAIFALAWKTNFLGIRDTMQFSIKFWTNIWKAFTSFLKGDTDAATEYLQEAWDAFVERFNKVFEKIFGIKDAWNKFMTFMRDALGKLVTYIRDTFSRIDWGLVGKYILQGLANGMLLGIPGLLTVATKVGETVLSAIKKSLGIGSPSVEAMKLGMFTAQGFQMGLQRVSPEDMARSLVQPITNQSNSQQQTINQYFNSGLTLRQIRGEIDQRVDMLANELIFNLGGV